MHSSASNVKVEIKNGKVAFLITKPLQLMVSLCISQQENSTPKPDFLIVNNFAGSSEISSQLQHNFTNLQNPLFFNDRKTALGYVKSNNYKTLFIDSDVGFRNLIELGFLKINNPNLSIHVYEEGLGTYRSDFYSGFKKLILQKIGAGTYFGGCSLVSNIYVYEAEEYLTSTKSDNKKVREIKNKLPEFIRTHRDSLRKLFSFNGLREEDAHRKVASLYLTSWNVDQEFFSKFQQLQGDLFVKAHPHIKTALNASAAKVIDAKVPAEILIMELAETYESVCVYDHFSSVRRYLKRQNLTYKSANPESIESDPQSASL